MHEYLVHFVALQDDKIVYVVKTIFGHRYPENETRDIMDVCAAVNANRHEDDKFKVVDVFRVTNAVGGVIWSEDIEEAPKKQPPAI